MLSRKLRIKLNGIVYYKMDSDQAKIQGMIGAHLLKEGNKITSWGRSTSKGGIVMFYVFVTWCLERAAAF
jgi:hypothetical protein